MILLCYLMGMGMGGLLHDPLSAPAVTSPILLTSKNESLKRVCLQCSPASQDGYDPRGRETRQCSRVVEAGIEDLRFSKRLTVTVILMACPLLGPGIGTGALCG